MPEAGENNGVSSAHLTDLSFMSSSRPGPSVFYDRRIFPRKEFK